MNRQQVTRVALRTLPAFALALVLTVAGCSASSGGIPAGSIIKPTTKQLTLASAQRVYNAYANTVEVARDTDDERLLLAATTDGQTPLTAAAYRDAVASGTTMTRYSFSQPRFYVPSLKPKGTQWFLVIARRASVEPDGKAGPTRTVALVFDDPDPATPWALSLATPLSATPSIAVDRQGYATALATFDSKVRVEPREVSAMQATLSEEGTKSIAARVMDSGAYDTAYFSADAAQTAGMAERGFVYDVIYESTGFPSFSLETTDGGAFVLYAMNRSAQTTRLSTAPATTPIPIPAAADLLIDPATTLVKKQFDVSYMGQYAAIDPPATSSARVEIVGATNAVVNAVFQTPSS